MIYGKNGSGKTNLGLALFDVTLSLNDNKKSFFPLEAYEDYLHADHVKEYATFIYEFKYNNDNVKYKYQKKQVDELLYEELSINNKVKVKYNFINGNKLVDIPEVSSLNFDFFDNKISIIKL